MYFSAMSLCYQAPNSQGGQFSLHLPHPGNRRFSLSMTKTSREDQVEPTIPSTTPLVSGQHRGECQRFRD